MSSSLLAKGDSSGHLENATSRSRVSDDLNPTAESGSDSDSASRSVWDELNVLTFDGGGVKGYYSLLQLQKLMEFIKKVEERLDKVPNYIGPPNHSSFSPCDEPRNVSHVGGTYTHYLPCHYFDYIAGTSTGALITIMLARLRMPVEDCLAEYCQFGGVVFGNPRVFHQVGKRGVFFSKPKYKTSHLEEAIKDVIRRRGEVSKDHDDAMPFTIPKGLCRAIVLANIEEKLKRNNLFLFRSYDHFHNTSLPATSGARRTTEEEPLNPGHGTRFAAWKVARAATAAKLFFKPLEVVKDDGEIVRNNRQRTRTNNRRQRTDSFQVVSRRTSSGRQMPTLPRDTRRPPETIRLVDAGYGRTNNPSEAILLELRHLLRNRNKKIDTWVSIGTARERTLQDGKKPHVSTSAVVHEGLTDLGDTEPAHEQMNRESQRVRSGFNYFRLNKPGGLRNMKMDEWKVSGDTNKTLEEIRRSFNEWAGKMDSIEMFQQCAEALVRNRRERIKNASRWERYALGKFYVCGEKNCSYDCDETWNYRDEFVRHLQEHHGMDNARLQATLTRCEQHWDYKAAPGSVAPRL